MLFNYIIFLPRRICFILPFFPFEFVFLWLLFFLSFLLGGCRHLGDCFLLKIYHLAKK
jgi:hypothetical protein